MGKVDLNLYYEKDHSKKRLVVFPYSIFNRTIKLGLNLQKVSHEPTQ